MKFRFLALILLAVSCKGPSIEVYDLRCEGLEEPLGIDSGVPHFSWKIESSGPVEQAAYEIEAGPGLWDSGKVTSDCQVMIPYGGRPLPSRTIGWWRVRVWSSDGKVSSWSRKQRFGVGIIGDDRLKGDYIGAVPGEGRSPKLRKVFRVDRIGKEAFLYVNSLGYHEAYLNGRKVSDAVLSPAVSQLDKRSLIVVYDVSDLLKEGENELLLWTGSGWYKPTTFRAAYDGPLVKAELDVRTEDGPVPVVWTDGSWEGSWSGYRDLGDWRPHRFAGERIDAGVRPEWGSVDVVPVEGIAASMQMCEPCEVVEGCEPVGMTDLGDGSWRIDFGRVLNAMLEVELPSLPAGHVTKVSYSDVDAETFDLSICGYDEFISSGDAGGDRFGNRFNHHVFRYVRLDSLPEAPKSVRARRMRTAFGTGSSFACSDGGLNAIHDLVASTMDNLAFNGYMVDCASIERLGYGGDGNASTLSLQVRSDVAPLYLNWLQAWADAQRPDGGLPHTAPNPYTAGGGPYWCSFLVQAPWRTYMSYADPRTAERFYPAMKHWLDYVDAYTVDGLLKRWPDLDYRGWYLGDWAAPKGVDVQDPSSVDLVNNCALCQSYAALERMALMLGEEADAADFRRRQAALKERIHQAFYHPESATYASGSQLDMVYPLLVGAVPEELEEKVRETLKERTQSVYGGHLSTGLVGVPVLTEWATLAGEADWMCGMLRQHGYPGYLHMLDEGATGVWEEWDGGRSHLHNCYNGIGSWFYQALGGILPEAPGYRRVRIAPQIPDGLEWVDVRQATPYGPVHVRRDGNLLRMEIPVGITAVAGGKEYGCGRHEVVL